MVKGSKASGELLDVSQPGGNLHPFYGLDLHRVAVNATFRDQEAEELAGWYSENALFWIELDLESAQILKGFLEIFQQRPTLFRLHHHIIHVDVGISAELLEDTFLHATLKGGAGIPQAERHGQVAEGSKRVMKEVFSLSAGFSLI